MNEINLFGIAASEGISIGRAHIYNPPKLKVEQRLCERPDVELARFAEARKQAGTEISVLRDALEKESRSKGPNIFDAHLVMLDDPMFIEAVEGHIRASSTAEAAVETATGELAALLSGMENELFAARAADLQDVGRRVLRILLGLPDETMENLDQAAVLVAKDLSPSDTASLNRDLILGFCTAAGGLTSHTAILARTLAIPAVVGLGQDAIQAIENGETIILDGTRGEVILRPAPETIRRYQDLRAKQAAFAAQIQASAAHETRTLDGRRVEVSANIGDAESAGAAVRSGAEGVGLLRTEFLYLEERQPPTEEKQLKVYRRIFEVMNSRPVIVRTLDIGGDKPPSFMKFEAELNPFLGWRAIRISLDNLPLFKTQLRAILRAATGFPVSIMFPMISSLDELHRAREVLAEVRLELNAAGLEYAQNVPVGIMVETPAAAVMADVLAEEVDFLSLGTNDLTQYTLAVDRTNERVGRFYQTFHPAVLRLIKTTIDAAHAHNIWAGMCGEMAGMKKAIPILLGLGLDEFSMAPQAIPATKHLIAQFTVPEAASIASEALSQKTALEVEALMDGILSERGDNEPSSRVVTPKSSGVENQS